MSPPPPFFTRPPPLYLLRPPQRSPTNAPTRSFILCATQPHPRQRLLTLLSEHARTPDNNRAITRLITQLESTPASAPSAQLPGIWRNVYTTRPPTSSVIQRTIVSNARLAPAVEQVILADESSRPYSVINRVDFRALLGGVLNVRAVVEGVHGRRLWLRFESAWFVVWRWPAWLGGRELGTAVRVPYPVPFRWLGDKARGWLDVSYLDEGLRIARGNRGSVFVLVRKKVDCELSAEDDAYLETWLD